MQRVAQAVAYILHRQHNVSMLAYLDDWLIFSSGLDVPAILHTIAQL
jgi:hypothetical protein